jgi:exodeoxyribonuclease-3
MKIVSWNVNGIRSILKTTFRDWLAAENPDIACLQETKADELSLTEDVTQIDGYYAYFNSSAKKGHSGVAVYSKAEPLSVEKKLGLPRFDDEGRCLKLRFKNFTLFNFYLPNGGRLKEDMGYKLDVYRNLFPILKEASSQPTLLAGDFNIAHTALDLHYPKQNENNTMFTPEERKKIETLLSLGYTDTFRRKYPEKKAYTWWSYADNARQNDIGWRIDYIFISQPLENFLEDAFTRREITGSDHGPYGITITINFETGTPPVYKRKEEIQGSLF